MYYTRNTNPCDSMKLRAVIGGWTDYYVNHEDDWVAFNVHGTRVTVRDNNPDSDEIVFHWDSNHLKTTIGGLIKATTLIDDWLKIG